MTVSLRRHRNGNLKPLRSEIAGRLLVPMLSLGIAEYNRCVAKTCDNFVGCREGKF